MKTALAVLLALGAPPLLRAVEPLIDSGDRLNAGNSLGAFYTASTRFNGRNSFIQLSKLTPVDFTIVWNSAHDNGSDERAHALRLDADGRILVAGSRRVGARWQTLLLKYTPDGELLWEQLLDSRHDAVPSAVEVLADGTIFIGATAHDGKSYAARLYKLWNLGTLDWQRDVSLGGHTYLTGLQADAKSISVQVESFQGNAAKPVRRVVSFDTNGKERP